MVLTNAEIEAEMDRLMEAPEVDEAKLKVNVRFDIFLQLLIMFCFLYVENIHIRYL